MKRLFQQIMYLFLIRKKLSVYKRKRNSLKLIISNLQESSGNQLIRKI